MADLIGLPSYGLGPHLSQTVQSGRCIVRTDRGCAHRAARQPCAAAAHKQHAAGVCVAQQRVRRPSQLLSEDSTKLVTADARGTRAASPQIPPRFSLRLSEHAVHREYDRQIAASGQPPGSASALSVY